MRRWRIADRGFPPVAANLLYLAAGIVLWSIVYRVVTTLPRPRGRGHEPARPWWLKKRWAAVFVFWLVVAYPLSNLGMLYLDGRGLISDSAFRATIPVYRPLNRVLFDGAGQPRRGFGWFHRARESARRYGEWHAWNDSLSHADRR